VPSKPLKPCGHAGCGKLTKQRYCETHEAQHPTTSWGRWQQDRGSNTERGYGWAWRKIRNKVMKRDKYLCQLCLKEDRVAEAYAVDHIIARAYGGTDDMENLQALCKWCHAVKTAKKRSNMIYTKG